MNNNIIKDVFFKLPHDKAEVVLKEAILLSTNIINEVLDCKISFQRQPTNKPTNEILEDGLAHEYTIYFFVIRSRENRTDIGLSTFGQPTYFLWINMDIPKAYNLAKKYKLKSL